MIFALDESTFLLDGISEESCLELLEDYLDLIDMAIEGGWQVFYSADLFSNVVGWGFSFYELYSEASPLFIPMEIRERVAAAFSILQRWDDGDLPDPMEVVINDRLFFAPTVAWMATKILGGEDASCLVFNSARRKGFQPIVFSEKQFSAFFVSDAGSYREAFRASIVSNSNNSSLLECYSKSAFPNLRFVDGVFSGIKDMSKPYLNMCAPIVHHLSALSDFGREIFSGDRAQVSGRFGALGVNITDENGNTKHDAKAMAQRRKDFKGDLLEFTWHSKLAPDRDRIHICPDKIQEDGYIIVGIFCYHLK